MTNEPRFDPMKEIQNVGEQISKEVEKRIRALTSGPRGICSLDVYEADGDLHHRIAADRWLCSRTALKSA